MSTELNKTISCMNRFIDILANEKDSLIALENGFRAICRDLHIGRVVGDMEKSQDSSENRFIDTKRILFSNEQGFDADSAVVVPYTTNAGAKGTFTIQAVPGYSYDEVDAEVLKRIVEVADLHLSRHYALMQVEERSLIQPVTGLPNPNGYIRLVALKIADGSIDRYDAYYFNLKSFGLVNKYFGQMEGNEIMRRYVEIIKNFIYEDELLGHLGGDNFVTLIRKGEHSEEFRKLINEVKTFGIFNGEQVPVKIQAVAGYMPVQIPCEIGKVIGGPAVALSYAKRNKIALVELTEELNRQAMYEKTIEQQFDTALAAKEFVVYYQPKVNSVSGEIIGSEALSRWIRNNEIIPPATFVPVLERANKVVKLDLYVLHRVCEDIALAVKEGRKVVPCSINFSRNDISDQNLPSKIMGIIEEYGIDKKYIVIEITETSSEEEREYMEAFLKKIKEYGIESSIDDFGTGYSSLSTLREYPVDEIKIDRSFIAEGLDENVEIILSSIIEMARKLKIDVIAEGVEEVEQKDFLLRLGCERIQGYLYDKPLPKEEFRKRLESGSYKI